MTHRPKPDGWVLEASFHSLDGVEVAVAIAEELAGGRIPEVAPGGVGGRC
ncbi:hypothetical protein [Arthrobacter sp. CAN_A1]